MHSLLLWISLTGCRGVDPAPADLDGILHWFWDHGDSSDVEEFAASVATLHEVSGAALTEAVDGEVSRLSAEQTEAFGVAADPANAAGIFLLNPYACTASHLERVLIHLAQDELYEGVYDRYDRSYLSDEGAYLDRSTDRLGWEVDIEAAILGSGYSEHIEGTIRAVDTPTGPALLTRTWLTEPATFEGGNKSWPQDWQLELYYEPEPGRIVHLYGMWREMDLGSGLSMDSGGVQRVTLNNLADWDRQTEVLCAENRP